MVLKQDIEKAYKSQNTEINKFTSIKRECFDKIDADNSHIEVISGIRRCGKSTLLTQIMKKYKKKAYLNLEDPRIFNFELEDFTKLDEIIGDDTDVYFFDEIQNVANWEVYIRQLYDRKKKIYVTGSNAAMLSKDLGTRLTGRHLRHELLPFSYSEYLNFKKKKNSAVSFKEYINEGGMPEYLNNHNPETLQMLLRDIVFRDIAVRYNIKNSKTLMDITLFLISNIAKEHTYNSIRKSFSIGSASSVSDYLNWLEDAYLFFFLQRFSWSSKKSAANPRKVYAIDTGLVNANSLSFTEDIGRLFENSIYLMLRQHNNNLFYFREKQECDFVVFNQNKLSMLVQVCKELQSDNYNREVNGLVEAMDFFDTKTGYIVTLAQKDKILVDDKEINVIPANEFYKSLK